MSLCIPISIMRLIPLLLRPTSNSPWLQHRFSTSPAEETAVSDKIFNILDSVSPIEPALEPLSSSIKPSTITYVLQEYPNLQLGFRFFIWAVRSWSIFNAVFGKSVVDLLSKDGGFELYWKALDEVRSFGISIAPRAFATLISAYAEVGMLEKSVESFCKMKDFDCMPDRFTYNSMLQVLVQRDFLLLALSVYNQMLKSNCRPSRSTYNILIDGSCKSGRIEDALKMFDEMALRGISADKMTYTIVISGLCRARKADHALRLFNKMKDNDIHPDLITCNALIHGFCKLGMMDQAFELVRQFEADGHVLGLEGFSCIIDGFFKAGQYDEAHVWYRKASEVGIEPDVVLYSILIRGLSEAGRLQDALILFNEMTEKGLVPDTICYNTLIKACCDLGLLDHARSLQLEISQHNSFPSVHTYTTLINGMCRNGLLGEAREMFNEMEKLGCYPSIVTFNTLIDGLCKAGNLEEAQLLFYKMEIGRNPSLFLRLSHGANRVVGRGSVQTTIEKMCESVNIVDAYKLLTRIADGAIPDIQTYNILINGFCRAGKISGAYMLFKELQRNGLSPNSVTYVTLIIGLQRVGQEKDAYEVLDNMLKTGCTPTSSEYKAIMAWECRKRNFSLAFSLWLKHLRNHSDWEDDALTAIEEHFEKGDVGKAVRALLEMDFKLNNFDLVPYTVWLIGFCLAQKLEEALKIYYVLQEYNVNVTPPSCVTLINSLCKERKLDLAVEVFHYTVDKGFILKPQVCNLLLKTLLRSREKKSQAFDILNRMKSLGYNLNDHLYQSTKSLIFQCNLIEVRK